MRTYYCKRIRMLEYLIGKGFKPYATLPDIHNPAYKVWAFEWNDALDEAMNEYFSSVTLTSTHN